ncbi:DNA packaging tegument protein UL25 [Common bottlenose dolphin gammaherpesvirus 1 strain Sarasota]|uniref:DNA packaging tegument protein UL25 n=1 Tax=Common bottlenose dolphin gammaherpesvirus 1 strain Sarasota TaxID=2022783 RepID=A0A1Z1NEE0_9GAMA|nr:DNA packaging tegument protein UL25 [Common bottlenose dolphin gammaherpesvirus 1 strain Sarasota]ARW78082.1 DNA packaging tegument protein UL25 [Common bottlenose dolphin gammaherpesvirus 1 strain Sarasota]
MRSQGPCAKTAAHAWSPIETFWAPRSSNVMYVNADHLSEVMRLARLQRALNVARGVQGVTANLVCRELHQLATTRLAESSEILKDLDTLEKVVGDLVSGESRENEKFKKRRDGDAVDFPQDDPRGRAEDASDFLYITIAQGDPGFNVTGEFQQEFLNNMYMNTSQWLPAFGPWYHGLAAAAMQRRVFPRELRGDANFKNSVSLKLMREVVGTALRATADVYADLRHLSDTQAALCLLNAHFCLRTAHPLPQTLEDLVSSLEGKMEVLINDLKGPGPAGGNFDFTYTRPQQRETLAPLNKSTSYDREFFAGHKIYQVLVEHGTLRQTPASPSAPHALPVPDYSYIIATRVFGENVPPFLNFQWNLRVGIAALEVLVLVYLVLEMAKLSPTGQRRLHLDVLLGPAFDPKPPQRHCKDSGLVTQPCVLKRGEVFSFLAKNYMLPLLSFMPLMPVSGLFPGVVLLALEAADVRHMKAGQPYINLTGKKFNDILDIIAQRLLIRDSAALASAAASLRLRVEDGLSFLLSRTSPLTLANEIIQTHFGGYDSYDRLYFLVLGFLPATMAVV